MKKGLACLAYSQKYIIQKYIRKKKCFIFFYEFVILAFYY